MLHLPWLPLHQHLDTQTWLRRAHLDRRTVITTVQIVMIVMVAVIVATTAIETETEMVTETETGIVAIHLSTSKPRCVQRIEFSLINAPRIPVVEIEGETVHALPVVQVDTRFICAILFLLVYHLNYIFDSHS